MLNIRPGPENPGIAGESFRPPAKEDMHRLSACWGCTMKMRVTPRPQSPRVPVCIGCGTPMKLVRIEPLYVTGEGWSETWNFRCSCGQRVADFTPFLQDA